MHDGDTVVAGDPMPKGQRFRIDRLRSLMEGLGLNPETMAEHIREHTDKTIAAETIRRWLWGKNLPQLHHLHAIADAFGVDLRLFFDPLDGSAMVSAKKIKRRKA